MKMEELKLYLGNPELTAKAIQQILGVPQEDCTSKELAKIAEKLNQVCKQEDNGSIILAIAQEVAKDSMNSMKHFHPDLLVQIFLMYGFVLGYLYRSKEKYESIPF